MDESVHDKHEMVAQPPPARDESFAGKWGIPIIVGIWIVQFLVKNKDGVSVLELPYAVALTVLVLVSDYVFRLLLASINKQPIKIYKPFDYSKQYVAIPNYFAKMGKRVYIRRFTPEPKYGEKSANSSYTAHVDAIEQLPSGRWRQLSFAWSILHNLPISYEPNHRHAETMYLDWSGAPKRDTTPPSGYYVSKPTLVQSSATNSNPVEEVSEEEEE